MYIKGEVKRDRVTKNLTERLNPGDIALISHQDLDEVAAMSLVEKEISCIINTEKTISGKYPNRGPNILLENKIPIIEVESLEEVSMISEGNTIEIDDGKILLDGKLITSYVHLDENSIMNLLEEGYNNIEVELDKFIENTLEYAKREKGLVTGKIKIPDIKTDLKDKHVLIVVRGQDYKRDLMAIKNYIEDIKPVLVGVDGGGDAILEFGYTPDIVIGDMDSVSSECLHAAKEVIVHGFPDGRVPAKDRMEELGIDYCVFSSPGTSEDIALLLAYEKNADLIVALGTHSSMIDFLEKGRPGMASTFLVRLKVGEKLVDARGVNKLYGTKFEVKYILAIILASFIPIIILILLNPITRSMLKLLKLKMRLLFI